MRESGESGVENLEIMEGAVRYARHVGHLVRSGLPTDGLLVEFGAGSGFQTAYVMPPEERLLCVEVDPSVRNALAERGYRSSPRLDDADDGSCAAIYSINCIEHIADDAAIVKKFSTKLKQGGRLVIYVPAMPILFSSMDLTVGHRRRYTRRKMRSLLEDAGYKIEELHYVDSLGIVPSFIYRFLPGASGQPSLRSVQLYDKLLFPVSKLFDRIFSPWFGKNLFVIATWS